MVKSFGIFQITDLKNEIEFVAERHLNYSLFTLHSSLNIWDHRSQMFLAYSVTERSAEKMPDRAMLIRLMRSKRSLSA